MSEAKHTPLPWEAEYHALVVVRDVAKALLENHWWIEDCGTALEDHLFMKLDEALSNPALKQAGAT